MKYKVKNSTTNSFAIGSLSIAAGKFDEESDSVIASVSILDLTGLDVQTYELMFREYSSAGILSIEPWVEVAVNTTKKTPKKA